MKSPPIIFSLAPLGFGGNLSQLFFDNIPSIILRPDKYNTIVKIKCVVKLSILTLPNSVFKWILNKICVFFSFPGLMLLIHGSGHQQNMSANNPENRMSGKIETDDESCSHCGGRNGKKRRGISCATLLFLLAIDAFTIALLLILFYNLKHWSGSYSVIWIAEKM